MLLSNPCLYKLDYVHKCQRECRNDNCHKCPVGNLCLRQRYKVGDERGRGDYHSYQQGCVELWLEYDKDNAEDVNECEGVEEHTSAGFVINAVADIVDDACDGKDSH